MGAGVGPCYTLRMPRALSVLALLVTLAPSSLLAKKGGTVAIECTVQGASVEIDGKSVGKTPLKPQSVSAGSHTIKVKKLGFLEYVEKVAVPPGKTTKVVADLLPFAGVLQLASNVAGAQVTVDGKPVGKAPLEVEVKLGKRTIAVNAAGYEPFTTTLQVDAGNAYPVTVKLAKKGAAAAPVAAAGGDELSLDLEPLAAPTKPGTAPATVVASAPPPGKTAGKPKPTGDELSLDLEPLAPPPPPPGKKGGKQAPPPPPAAEDDDPMALVALVPAKKTTPGATPPPPPATTEPTETAALPPQAILAGPEPFRPWYKRYWLWGAAGGSVAGGVVLGMVLKTDATVTKTADIGMRPGDTSGSGKFTPPTVRNEPPIHRRMWVWSAAGALLAGGLVLSVALPGDDPPPMALSAGDGAAAFAP